MTGNIILHCLQQHARQRGDTLALRDDRVSVDYRALLAAVTHCAAVLAGSGAQRILLDADNGIPWAVADLAAMSLGVTLIPIPGFFSDTQVAHVARVTSADLVLADGARASRWIRDGEWTEHGSEHGLAVWLPTRGTAIHRGETLLAGKVTFTSGSTGSPKGVALDNESISATSGAIVAALAPLEPNEHIAVLPLATLLENIAGLYAPLMNGSAVHLPAAERIGLTGASLDPQRFCELLSASTADTMILVPQLLTAVVTLVELELLSLPSFRLIAVGGGRVSPALLQRATALGLPVCEGYGLSECCSVLTLNLPGQQRPGSVGRPLEHARLRISDVGEVEVSEPVMAGYLDGDSLQRPERWYRTGDLGHSDDDGFLYIDGRMRNVFITAYGRNVNPEWPEAALLQHAAVAQAMVVGEARSHNLALLWLRFPQPAEDIQDLVDLANAELPDYARIQGWVLMDDALDPALQTDNGRLRRDKALQQYAGVIEQHYRDSADHLFPTDRTRSEHAFL